VNPTAPPRRGVYDAHRTAALAGIPYSTLQYWAREGIVVPSISPDRVRLWSWSDLLKLRAVTWLRKQQHVSMPRVVELLGEIDELGLGAVPLQRLVLVSRQHQVFVKTQGSVMRVHEGHQLGIEWMLDLIAPYDSGPDLISPRPHLSIIPGKLTGQPHVVDTRISSLNLYSLHQSGYDDEQIRRFFPEVSAAALLDAIDLENSLDRLAA
jgi:uncharacterized protein (DUF433 family)/DNA-binding transcriptional MerR regulator